MLNSQQNYSDQSLEKITKEVKQLSKRLANSEQEKKVYISELQKLRTQLASAERARLEVINSRIWRYTQPYRLVATWVKSKIKKRNHSIDKARSQAISCNPKSKSVPTGELVREKVDVCIVTNCRFPGGNASSTIDELKTFKKAGLKVLILHAPLGKSRRPIATRYDDYWESIVHIEDVQHIQTKVLIIRGPRIPFETEIHDWSSRIDTERCVIVVNNSAYRPSGDIVFKWSSLREVVNSLPWRSISVHPLGPAIRSEAVAEGVADLLDPSDWNPTFDATAIPFIAKSTMSRPFVIGRHGRDGAEKWLEDPEHLQAVFPDVDGVRILILGGATAAVNILGKMPLNWEVYPFGSKPVAEFLHELDAFVYFPHSQLNEAFGRTVVEAMFAGLPCILPKRFESTFGDMAIYCDPAQVQSALRRLSSDDLRRIKYVTEVRRESELRYESQVLFRRLSGAWQNVYENSHTGISESSKQFKRWVEGGDCSL